MTIRNIILGTSAALTALTALPLAAAAQTAPPRPDAAVQRELTELRRENAALIGRLISDPEAAKGVKITWLGKGRTEQATFAEPKDDRSTTPGAEAGGFVAFNPVSGNEFMIEIPTELRRRIGAAGMRAGINDPGTDEPAAPERVDPTREDYAAKAGPLLQKASWSGGVDNRTRLSSLTKGTDRWVWRAIADFGGCTGTLVGPRHVVTAGHCIYNRTTGAWASGFNVTPGRAGNNWNYGQALVPSAPFTWYFTPVGWRQANPSGGTGQYDIGILVISERLGDATSWMGWWYGTNTYLQTTDVYNRGYPLCNSSTPAPNSVPRTDDPGDTGSTVTCNGGHLYGDQSTCSIGSFSASDGMGWTRRFKHSCDASAGQSGSPLYLFRDNQPYVTAVHTTSSCGMVSTSAKCGASDTRPLTATRITQEYSDWLVYFRAWKP